MVRRVIGTVRRIPQWRIIRDSLWVGGGAALSRFASLLTLVVLTRHLAKADFALYSLGWGVWLMASLLPVGLDLAYVDLQAREDDRASMLATYWRIKLQGCAALAITSTVVIVCVASPLGWERSETLAAAVGGGTGAATALYATHLSYLQVTQQFNRYATAMSLQNIGVLVATLLLILLDAQDPNGYLAIYGLIPLALTSAAWLRDGRRAAAWSSVARRRLFEHGRWLLPGSALQGFSSRIELVIAAAMLAPGEFALYGAAARLFGLFQVALVNISTVLLPRASRLGRDGTVQAYLGGSLGLTVAVGLAGVLVTWQAEPLATLILGAPYGGVANLVPALCVAAVFLAANSTLRLLLFSVRRPGGLAGMNAIMLIVKVAAALLLIPPLGVTGVAWSVAISFAVGTGFALAVVWRDRGRIGMPEAAALDEVTRDDSANA